MPDRPRARCPECSLSAPVRKDGKIGAHPVKPARGFPAVRCSGAGSEPVSPRRLQLKRQRGFRLPEGARSVARPSRFGNPWTVEWALREGRAETVTQAREFVVRLHRAWLERSDPDLPDQIRSGVITYDRRWVLAHLEELAGLDLACYCDDQGSCHALTLIDLANKER
jgi:hypothetical protein